MFANVCESSNRSLYVGWGGDCFGWEDVLWPFQWLCLSACPMNSHLVVGRSRRLSISFSFLGSDLVCNLFSPTLLGSVMFVLFLPSALVPFCPVP